MDKIEKAAAVLKNGGFVIVYDAEGREGEADLMFHPKFATWKKIERMRKDAGGLVCVGISRENTKKLGIPFLSEILNAAGMKRIVCRKTAYGDKPAFSIPINHRKVHTGITDADRALTIKEVEKTLKSKNPKQAEGYARKNKVIFLEGREIWEK